MSALRLHGAERILVGGPEWTEVTGDVLVENGKITAVGEAAGEPGAGERRVDCRGLTLMPGLVQSHVHVAQTLFRGQAEDRPLLPWLRERIWPLEAAHDEESLRASARLSVLELLLGGTTTVLDMGTTHRHRVVFETFEETGLRAASGKAMMDAGDGVPAGLLETTLDSLRESFDLAERWDGAAGGRLRYAFAPRFALSCTDELFREVVSLARDRYLLHTHASESAEETRAVEALKGKRNLRWFRDIGFLGPRTLVAHCVWVDDDEIDCLAETGAHALHCPHTNLKLGSGVCGVRRLRDAGVNVSIGADGAPANNALDGFAEMRVAGQLAAWQAGPGALSARDVLTMATRAGAEALGWGEAIGRVEVGREADLIAVALETPHAVPLADAVTALVYSARADDVRHVLVQGEVLVEDRRPVRLDVDEVLATARREATRVVARAAAIAQGVA